MTPRERTHRSVPPGTAIPPKEAMDEVVTLRLADLFDRLPAPLLAPGEHDVSQTITFEIADIAKQIADGRPNIELAEIHRKLPGIFASEVKTSDNIQVRFPWQKLVEMLRAADSNHPSDGLTRAAALHLARLLRGHRTSFADRTFGRIAAGAAALARAPQWFTRNIDNFDSAAEGERILRELASTLEQFAPSESADLNSADEHIESSDALEIATEENIRLRQEIDERDREIESLRKTLAELECAAIDQIAALNQQCEEYETARARPPTPHPEQIPPNPQQTALIDSLSQQVAELYKEIDRARDDALQATAAHAKYREQNVSSEAAAKSMQQYLESVAYELERANAVLKEMETKAHQTEKAFATKDAEIQRLAQELSSLTKKAADISMERDALRGQLYASSSDRITGTAT